MSERLKYLRMTAEQSKGLKETPTIVYIEKYEMIPGITGWNLNIFLKSEASGVTFLMSIFYCTTFGEVISILDELNPKFPIAMSEFDARILDIKDFLKD